MNHSLIYRRKHASVLDMHTLKIAGLLVGSKLKRKIDYKETRKTET
jgi:hypothetical protein